VAQGRNEPVASLILRVRRMVQMMLIGAPSWADTQAIEGDALETLAKAMHERDSTDESFETYVFGRVRATVIEAIRRTGPRTRGGSARVRLTKLSEIYADSSAAHDLEVAPQMDQIIRAMQDLSLRDKEIVYALLVEGRTYADVASQQHLSANRVLEICNHALGQIRVSLGISEVKSGLTKRERQVLSLAADGETEHSTAAKIFVSPSTVKRHRKHIIQKLGVKNITEAVADGFRKGFLL